MALLDEPVFRIPRMRKLPKIDGAWSASEWEDASAVSAFWSSNVRAVPYPAYQHLAPHQIQSRVYAGYDQKHLYLAYLVSTYPNNAWLKARGRFPDVYNHPRYGMMQDDHIEIELRPYHELTKGFKMGFFKWFANPLGVISDQYYTQKAGLGKAWQSKALVRAGETSSYWIIELRIPLAEMVVGDYAKKSKTGQPSIKLPPPDGTTYRSWFKNGIGGASRYTVLFDQHVWRGTKTRLVLDSSAVSFQINHLGPVMEDIVDLKLTLKNHHARSETVQLGFFMENAEGTIYSSYEDEATKEGLIELRPGEVKKLRLRKKFPGISPQMNYLWFDIRTAGRPAKVIFQNRLAEFHSIDPGLPYDSWQEEKLGAISKMRPPKKDFEFNFQYSPYTSKLAAVVDVGIHGASDKAKTAIEAKLMLQKKTVDEELVIAKTVPFHKDFATFLFDVPHLKKGEYFVTLLLFDKNKRIVGERSTPPFSRTEFAWEKNKLGLEDIVWTPFKALKRTTNTLETIRHTITVAPSGLPAQIAIKPDPRELPLERRARPERATQAELAAIGRGRQLLSPLRIEAVVNGARTRARVVEPARLVRQWKSEIEYSSKLRAGPLDMSVNTQYDCDGAMTVKFTYGTEKPVNVDLLELVMEVAGTVDQRVGGAYGMRPASGTEMALPETPGVVWDSANHEHLEPFELYYSKFVPFFYFGSGDRAWSWLCDSDEDWLIDRNGSTMTLERDKDGQVTWRVKFVNHPAVVKGKRTIEFVIFTHPCKFKEKDYRKIAWIHQVPCNYEGIQLKCLPNDGPFGIDGSDETFKYFRKRYPNGAPRLYFIKNWLNSGIPELQKRAYTGEWLGNQVATVNNSPMDAVGGYGQPWVRRGKAQVTTEWGSQSWEDYYIYNLERMIRLGKVPGYWWDETWPPVRTDCLANGQAYLRDPKDVGKGELPWQAKFGSLHIRNLMKRQSRLLTKNKIPNYNAFWASSTTAFESYGRHSTLTESAGGTSDFQADHVTKYPLSFIRYCANTNKGLTTNILPMLVGLKGSNLIPGDTLRMERAVLGRCLLHDIGQAGAFPDPEQMFRVLDILYDFGYFASEDSTEMIPYWRSRSVCRYGEAYDAASGFETAKDDPYAQVYTTVYRREFKTVGGKRGYKAMFVVMNESDTPVRGRLHIFNSKALLGGKNNLLVSDIFHPAQRKQRYPLRRRRMVASFIGRRKALMDLERRGAAVQATRGSTRAPVKGEIYGPIYIPSHDYRILLAQFDPEPEPAKRFARAAAKAAGIYPLRHNLRQRRPWWETWKTLDEKLELLEKTK